VLRTDANKARNNSDTLAKEFRERFHVVFAGRPATSSCSAQVCVDDEWVEGLFRATVMRDYILHGLAWPRRLLRTSRGAKFLS
jgi:hypothetical protein